MDEVRVRAWIIPLASGAGIVRAAAVERNYLVMVARRERRVK